jgi:uncharacterized membrane protein
MIMGITTGMIIGVTTGMIIGITTGMIIGITTGMIIGVTTGTSVRLLPIERVSLDVGLSFVFFAIRIALSYKGWDIFLIAQQSSMLFLVDLVRRNRHSSIS